MSINSIGTILRIVLIFLSVVLVWFIPILISYYVICLVLGIEFTIIGSLYVFGVVIVIRAFYPKNVVQG